MTPVHLLDPPTLIFTFLGLVNSSLSSLFSLSSLSSPWQNLKAQIFFLMKKHELFNENHLRSSRHHRRRLPPFASWLWSQFKPDVENLHVFFAKPNIEQRNKSTSKKIVESLSVGDLLPLDESLSFYHLQAQKIVTGVIFDGQLIHTLHQYCRKKKGILNLGLF